MCPASSKNPDSASLYLTFAVSGEIELFSRLAESPITNGGPMRPGGFARLLCPAEEERESDAPLSVLKKKRERGNRQLAADCPGFARRPYLSLDRVWTVHGLAPSADRMGEATLHAALQEPVRILLHLLSIPLANCRVYPAALDPRVVWRRETCHLRMLAKLSSQEVMWLTLLRRLGVSVSESESCVFSWQGLRIMTVGRCQSPLHR